MAEGGSLSCPFRVGQLWVLINRDQDRPFVVIDTEVDPSGRSCAHLVVYLDDGFKGVVSEWDNHPMEENFMFKRIE